MIAFFQRVYQFIIGNELLIIFLCVALGAALGSIRFGKKFTLGSTVSTLIVAVIIGQVTTFTLSGSLQMMFIYLCIFTVGFETGPSSVSSFKHIGVKVIILSLIFVVLGTVLAIGSVLVLGLTPGMAAGSMSGGLTQSAGLVAAQEALGRMGLDPTVAESLKGDVAVSYAVSYIISMIGMVIVMRLLEPKLLGVSDLKQYAQDLAKKRGHVEEVQEDGSVVETHGRHISLIAWGLASALAVLLGGISFKIAGINVTVGGVVAILIIGIVCGVINSKNPKRCHFSSGARWFMNFVGFNVFIAMSGIGAAKTFVAAMKAMGIQIIIAGCIVAFGTHLVAMVIGRYLMRMDPVDVLGTQCGAGTYVVGYNALVEATGTTVFGSSYAAAYTIGNTLLTIFCPVIIYVMMAIMK